MNAIDFLREARSRGVEITLPDPKSDRVALRGPQASLEWVKTHGAPLRTAIVDLLRRQTATIGTPCAGCAEEVPCVPVGHVRLCGRCIECVLTGCARFSVLASSDEKIEEQRGICLACGAPWYMHGAPSRSEWRKVRDLEDVDLVAARYVLASATAIARGAR